MSGHSKWSTIKRKKGAEDAKRANAEGKVAMIEIRTRQETRFSTYPDLLVPA